MGGLFEGTHTASCMRMNLSSELWDEIAPLQVAREYHSSCVLGDRIYTVAGSGYDGILNSIEVMRLAEQPEEQINE